MKKIVLWLIKVFKLDIPTVMHVEEVKRVYVLKANRYEHDLTVEGNLTVEGQLDVKGEITCYKMKEKKI